MSCPAPTTRTSCSRVCLKTLAQRSSKSGAPVLPTSSTKTAASLPWRRFTPPREPSSVSTLAGFSTVRATGSVWMNLPMLSTSPPSCQRLPSLRPLSFHAPQHVLHPSTPCLRAQSPGACLRHPLALNSTALSMPRTKTRRTRSWASTSTRRATCKSALFLRRSRLRCSSAGRQSRLLRSRSSSPTHPSGRSRQPRSALLLSLLLQASASPRPRSCVFSKAAPF
jgi:hypothetical protein